MRRAFRPSASTSAPGGQSAGSRVFAVAAGLLDLFLGQPSAPSRICLAEVGAVEMCLREQGVSSA